MCVRVHVCTCVCVVCVCLCAHTCLCACVCVCVSFVVVTFVPPFSSQHEPILDILRYRELQQVLFSEEKLKYLDIMANIFRHHHADLARVLVHLYGSTGCHEIVPLIMEASSKVVKKEGTWVHTHTHTHTRTRTHTHCILSLVYP